MAYVIRYRLCASRFRSSILILNLFFTIYMPMLSRAQSIRPVANIPRHAVDESSMQSLVQELVDCGTRNSFSSWTNPARGIGCGRDRIVERLSEIAKSSGSRLQVVVDKFEVPGSGARPDPLHLENVYAVLPGYDRALAKTVFIVSGHFDSRASDVNDAEVDAPGADDDASGVAVSVECARLLAAGAKNHAPGRRGYRATILFAAVSGEEQGLLGGARMLQWVRQQGYSVGGMLDDDIVGSVSAASAERRIRVFSGEGTVQDNDSSSRELARAVEEIVGVQTIRLVPALDRPGRGGDQIPFYNAGFPAVRFTEPVEDLRRQHQNVRTENGVEYGDLTKYLNAAFMGEVAWVNSEALLQFASAPAPPNSATVEEVPERKTKILKWSFMRDSARADFEILSRQQNEATWKVLERAKNLSEVSVPSASVEDCFLAVRSVGTNGFRSIAVPVQMAPR